jgi:SAM-dependent methyltransferase
VGSQVTGAPPDAYERHVGRYGPALAARMIEIAGVQPGQRALDVGCGPGALAAALAERLGAQRVAAVDPSPRFVERCRAHAPGVDVRVAVAEELPFQDGSFDAVLAQLVVDGMDDAPRGVREMRRVGRDGGMLAACVWDFDGGMSLLCTVRDAALAFDEQRARSFGAGVRQPFSRPDELVALWRGCHLDEVEAGDVEVGADYAGFDDLWYPFAQGVGGFGRFVQSLSGQDRAAFEAEVARRFGSPHGSFRLSARAWWVRGRVPAAPG